MNLDQGPMIEQLRNLLLQQDDSAGHHVLWVRKNGAVEVSRLHGGQTATGFQAEHPDMRLCYEPFLAGNEYVGPAAAQDEEWLRELFDSLLHEWSQANGADKLVYLEKFVSR
jgi:hypothetical protein